MPETQTIPTSDTNKTLYNINGFGIFWRNFLAGFAHGLGSVFVYIVFLIIMAMIFVRVILPTVQPLLNTYSQAMSTMQQVGKFTKPFQNSGTSQNQNTQPNSVPVNIDNSTIQNLLNQFQKQAAQQTQQPQQQPQQ